MRMRKKNSALDGALSDFSFSYTGFPENERRKDMTEEVNFSKIAFANDFMFCSVLEDAELCREFLERVLDIEIAELRYSEKQKTIKNRMRSKGIRLDVYARDVKGNVYDIEMQTSTASDLGLRSRYYHSEMDSYQLREGIKYSELKKSFVIFVCLSDLFQMGRSVYTFRQTCQEQKDLVLDDRQYTLFLNASGAKDGLPEGLVKLLEYIQTGNATDGFTEKLADRVEVLRYDDDWRENYMTLEMKMDEKRQEGRLEGLQEGLLKGRAETLVSQICKKLAKGNTAEEIAEILEEEPDEIKKICEAADKYAPEYDKNAILRELGVL